MEKTQKMNVDLVISKNGEIGLIADAEFESPVSAVIFDYSSHTLSLEHAQTFDSTEMNIPVDYALLEAVTHSRYMHVGVVKDGEVMDVKQVSLSVIGE